MKAGHHARHIQVQGVIRGYTKHKYQEKKRKEKKRERKRRPKPRVLLATGEDPCGVTNWIIPECDCYYCIKAHEDHAL